MKSAGEKWVDFEQNKKSVEKKVNFVIVKFVKEQKKITFVVQWQKQRITKRKHTEMKIRSTRKKKIHADTHKQMYKIYSHMVRMDSMWKQHTHIYNAARLLKSMSDEKQNTPRQKIEAHIFQNQIQICLNKMFMSAHCFSCSSSFCNVVLFYAPAKMNATGTQIYTS